MEHGVLHITSCWPLPQMFDRALEVIEPVLYRREVDLLGRRHALKVTLRQGLGVQNECSCETGWAGHGTQSQFDPPPTATRTLCRASCASVSRIAVSVPEGSAGAWAASAASTRRTRTSRS